MEKIKRVFTKLLELRPRGFWPGFTIGIFYFSYIFWWVWSLYPLDALGIENNFYAVIALLFIFSVSVVSMAFFWGVFSFFSLRVLKSTNILLLAPAIAGLFVILEYLRSWGFGIVWWGSGSLMGPHWTLGNPAYLFSFSKYILNTASIWGIYGIDFFIVLILISIFLCIRKQSKLNLWQLFLAILIFFLAGFLSKPVDAPINEAVRIILIQTANSIDISSGSEGMISDFNKKLSLLKDAAKRGNIIVFSETSNLSRVLSGFLNTNSVQNYFNKLSENPVMILDNIRIMENNRLISKTIFINSKNGIDQFTDKELLTPVGEYLPYTIKWPLRILSKSFVNSFAYSREFSRGIHTENLSFQDKTARVVICSEILSPVLFRNTDYQFIIGQDSLGMFNGNKSIEFQLLSALRFRSAENKKPAVLASNYGRSYVINDSGRVIKSTDSPGYQILTADIVPNEERTWYNKLGDFPILLLSLAVFGLSLINFKHAKQD